MPFIGSMNNFFNCICKHPTWAAVKLLLPFSEDVFWKILSLTSEVATESLHSTGMVGLLEVCPWLNTQSVKRTRSGVLIKVIFLGGSMDSFLLKNLSSHTQAASHRTKEKLKGLRHERFVLGVEEWHGPVKKHETVWLHCGKDGTFSASKSRLEVSLVWADGLRFPC